MCNTWGKALTDQKPKGGPAPLLRLALSLLKRGSGACDTPKVNSKRFEGMLSAWFGKAFSPRAGFRELVRLVTEEMDSVVQEQREKVGSIGKELIEA